jgi:hypothetical protein
MQKVFEFWDLGTEIRRHWLPDSDHCSRNPANLARIWHCAEIWLYYAKFYWKWQESRHLRQILTPSLESSNSSWILANLASTTEFRSVSSEFGCTSRNFVGRRRNLDSAAGFQPQSLEFHHRWFFVIGILFVRAKHRKIFSRKSFF